MSKLSESIHELRSQGLSYNEIRTVLGCSKGTISYYLGVGQQDKNLERQRRRRRTVSDTIKKIKQESCCADCGEYYPYWVMDFDHRDTKNFTISQYRRYNKNLEDVLNEIKLCDIVCANCHRTRTHSRRTLSKHRTEFFDASIYYT